MKYTEKRICDATTAELLLAIIHAEGLSDGPGEISFGMPVQETLIGIGKDNTARILLFEDDLEALNRIVS